MSTPALTLSFPSPHPSSYPSRDAGEPAAWASLGEQLFPFLQAVPDPRGRQGRRYGLPLLLAFCLVGLCCGCQGYLSIARWGRALKREGRQELGFLQGRTPCAATLLNLFPYLETAHRHLRVTGDR